MGTPPKDTPTEIQILDIKAILDAGAERPLLQSLLGSTQLPQIMELQERAREWLAFATMTRGDIEVENSPPLHERSSKTTERELQDARVQVERLKTIATTERRVAAYEGQRYEELLNRYDRLLEQVKLQGSTLLQLNERMGTLLRRCGSITREFYKLTAIWKTMTIHISDVTEKCSHPAYQQIIHLGPAILPLIFDELEDEPDDWFVALCAITGINPVPMQSRGNLNETTLAWLTWAKDHGHRTDRGDSAEERFPAPRLEYVFQGKQENDPI